MTQRYFDSTALIDRLCHASDSDRNVTFLLGSPISVPDYVGGHGVPGVSGMIDLIREEFEGTKAGSEFDQKLKGDLTDQYRIAFEFLHGRRGQGAVNRIVRTAVWRSLAARNWPSDLPNVAPEDADDATCSALETAVDAWVLPRAVDTLGNLLASYPDTFGGAVLTTNFDPLIEVSVLKHGGRHYRTVLHDDGKLGQTVAEGTHIIHLHGYWYGYDTLHTPYQLMQPRPQLSKSLARVVEASTLVVLGYGGWDDVITGTLIDLLADSESNPEIVWAFHGDDTASIEAANNRLLDGLSPGIGRGRVSLYRGIDCHSVLSEVFEQLKPSYTSKSDPANVSRIATIVKEKPRRDTGQGLRVEIDIAMPQEPSSDPDRPLFVDDWVGREHELRLLASSNTPVAFITGIGGQGKSGLAGRFLQQNATKVGDRFKTWDWRDCREESDRLNTLILRIIERLSGGIFDGTRIENNNIKALIGVLFHVLKDKRALLVFDNVDQYVDLETLEPIKGLEVLVSEAQARSHGSLFLFTCRPDITVDESRTVKLSLPGLSVDETEDLLAACGVRKEDRQLAGELHATTEGHPLWIRLVAMQAIRLGSGLREALDLVRKGGATLPQTTRTIWDQLSNQQRRVLRTMAELDRPETESRLLDFLPGVNVNRVNRALKTLRSFHLVETRTKPEGEPLLGLHPIIREFVRNSFPKSDRERYVGSILGFLEREIDRYKNLLSQEPAYEIMEYWARKADFLVRFGHFEEATSTIAEIVVPLVQRGYSEEMIRLAMLLFNGINWAEACLSYRAFDVVFQQSLRQMIQVRHEATEELLRRYEDAIPGRGTQYILLCDLWCYADWYSGKYESAIWWGEEGRRLKARTPVDTGYSTAHNLALSQRDAGRVDAALEFFLDGESLEAVAAPGKRIEGKEAHFYGNIGRCLFLDDRVDQAVACYVKSAQLLEDARAPSNRLQRGYIRNWIAELLTRKLKFEQAAAIYRAAVCMWEESSPPRAQQAEEKLKELVKEHPELGIYLDRADREVEVVFERWLNRYET